MVSHGVSSVMRAPPLVIIALPREVRKLFKLFITAIIDRRLAGVDLRNMVLYGRKLGGCNNRCAVIIDAQWVRGGVV